jgi:hypothetical protein
MTVPPLQQDRFYYATAAVRKWEGFRPGRAGGTRTYTLRIMPSCIQHGESRAWQEAMQIKPHVLAFCVCQGQAPCPRKARTARAVRPHPARTGRTVRPHKGTLAR